MGGHVWTLELRAPSTVETVWTTVKGKRVKVMRPAVAWLTMNRDRQRHWAKKASIVKQWRELTHWAALAAGLPKGCVQRARVDVELRFSSINRRDTTNWHPTGKAILDALTAGTKRHPGYGFLPDDSPRFLHCQECPHITISPDLVPADRLGPVGLVVVTITEQEP